MNFNNWVVIYPHNNKQKIKENFDSLSLEESSISLVIISDNLSEKEEEEYTEFINKNLTYNGYINFSSEENLLNTLDSMAAVPDDTLYTLKDDKVTKSLVEL